MENTTIAIKHELKKKIMEFGMKGESYNDILERLVESAKERQLHDLLFNEEGTVTIEEARREVEKKWPRS
jgi:predicted CopG family antitoxin